MAQRGLPDHFERHLGAIAKGHAGKAFSVVTFANEVSGGVPYATLGLSDHVTNSSRSGKAIRQELFMLLPRVVKPRDAVGVLEWAGKNLVADHSALLRGEVIDAQQPFFARTDKDSLFVASPVYLPESFGGYDEEAGEIIIVWLVPITRRESEYVSQHGWSAFERLLEEADPDLVDIRRPSIV